MRTVRLCPRGSPPSALLLTILLSACATWHTVEAAPEVVIRDQAPRLVRLTFTDRPVYTLRTPTLSGDSVIGELASSPLAVPERQALPLGTISAVAVRRTDAAKTVLLIVGGALVLSLVQCALSQCLDLGAPY